MRVFVYGSLLPGMHHHAVAEQYATAMEPGRVRGRLIDAGEYPALLLGGPGSVRGVWLTVGREGLAAMDALEEYFGVEESNDYERVWLRDADRPEIAGWAYVWADARGFLEADGDWWPDVVRRR
ncbi:gamma-glutamylcyclotransferase family protein [Cohnella caldifontis]|uniref:gamma-glutamylcyclotransferase family protein n=1 Tax=Cohnella caldifontis TaxID=3027471 RepID=UPI0023EC9182|nr:gamma-glutamylcyclotransferase family protein [Cohnella sp. YIM B05605]